MAEILLHPIRLGPTGGFVTAPAGSDAVITSSIAQHAGTVIGERPMCWPFGVPDPTFRGLTTDDVQASIDRFGPDGVEVTAVSVQQGDTVDVTVRWERITQ